MMLSNKPRTGTKNFEQVIQSHLNTGCVFGIHS